MTVLVITVLAVGVSDTSPSLFAALQRMHRHPHTFVLRSRSVQRTGLLIVSSLTTQTSAPQHGKSLSLINIAQTLACPAVARANGRCHAHRQDRGTSIYFPSIAESTSADGRTARPARRSFHPEYPEMAPQACRPVSWYQAPCRYVVRSS